MLSPLFHIHATLKIRPSPLSKIGGNACGAHFLHMLLYRKNEYGVPHF